MPCCESISSQLREIRSAIASDSQLAESAEIRGFPRSRASGPAGRASVAPRAAHCRATAPTRAQSWRNAQAARAGRERNRCCDYVEPRAADRERSARKSAADLWHMADRGRNAAEPRERGA